MLFLAFGACGCEMREENECSVKKCSLERLRWSCAGSLTDLDDFLMHSYFLGVRPDESQVALLQQLFLFILFVQLCLFQSPSQSNL